MTAKERWGNWHPTTRLAIVFGLITSAWLVLSGAWGGITLLFVTRPDFDRYVQQQAAARELHALRDSARQENTNRQLRYIVCRVDNPRGRCLDP